VRHVFADTYAAMLAVLEKRTLAEAIAAADMAASHQGDYGRDVFRGAFI
jgi:hypothetical protein